MNTVCLKCAQNKGARVPEGHIATTHIGECMLCGKSCAVTKTRNFGITRRLLESDEGLRYCETDGFIHPVKKMDGFICPKCRVILK